MAFDAYRWLGLLLRLRPELPHKGTPSDCLASSHDGKWVPRASTPRERQEESVLFFMLYPGNHAASLLPYSVSHN